MRRPPPDRDDVDQRISRAQQPVLIAALFLTHEVDIPNCRESCQSFVPNGSDTLAGKRKSPVACMISYVFAIFLTIMFLGQMSALTWVLQWPFLFASAGNTAIEERTPDATAPKITWVHREIRRNPTMTRIQTEHLNNLWTTCRASRRVHVSERDLV
jgi:hypothetical protein